MSILGKGLITAVLFSVTGVVGAIQSDVSSGKTSTLFIQNGSLYCSGSLASAACGDGGDYFDDEQKAAIASTYVSKTGDGYSYFEPTYINGADNVASVDAIYFKSAWLTKDGHVFWMGRGANGKVASPVEIAGFVGATDFTLMGDGNTEKDLAFAVIGGQAYAYSFQTNTTTQVSGLPGDVVAVDADSTHVLFLTATGELFAAGDNAYGQLGSGNMMSTSYTNAVQVVNENLEPLVGVQKISTGHDLSMAVVDGTPYAWGRNKNGALGLGSYDEFITRDYAGAIENFEGSAVNVSTNGATLIHGANGNLYGMGWHNGESLRNPTPTILVEGGVEELYVNNGDTWFIRHNGEIKGMGGALYGQQGHGSQRETHIFGEVDFIGSPDMVEVIVEVPVEVEVPTPAMCEVNTVEVIKEIRVEVPVEVIKTVIVEVPVEVIKIVEVEVIKEVIVEVPVEVAAPTVKSEKVKKSRKAKRGWGYGDNNHVHTGPKGRNKTKAKCK